MKLRLAVICSLFTGQFETNSEKNYANQAFEGAQRVEIIKEHPTHTITSHGSDEWIMIAWLGL